MIYELQYIVSHPFSSERELSKHYRREENIPHILTFLYEKVKLTLIEKNWFPPAYTELPATR